MTAAVAELKPIGEARVALESFAIQANLRALFSEVVVTQTYRNLEQENIEAVYTFPLPLDAVLLDLVLELNGKTLRGMVQAKTQAEERYEDAIDEGNSAILLQQLEPGLFSLNVGNILPNEQAVVRFRYAQLHRWQGDRLRFHLPTTIAPRYGDPAASGLAAHQVPEHALTADHGFSLAVRIEGALATADFECPSHPVSVSTSDGAREIALSGGSALMDRDFVLVIREPAASTAEALYAPDEDAYVVLASFHPQFPADLPQSPRCIKLVVDCSGSMNGDSIAQARAALREIIALLKPDDYFNLITFGSTFELLFPQPVIASESNIHVAARYIAQIDANMGGTEIGTALNAAYDCGTIEGLPTDILLITDGEVWEQESIIENARQSGHRIFSVGVGSAVSEPFVRRLAETTSGACELVSTRENMSERIVRHFQRIDQPRAKSVHIEWPSRPIRQIPDKVETVYAGDTLHAFAWLAEQPTGSVRLVMVFEDGRTATQALNISTDASNNLMADLPRVAAHARLSSLDSEEAAELAEHYQLVTEQTSCILVFDREADEKATEVPALRKVPQVLAAGWGGTGSVLESRIVEQSNVMYSRVMRRLEPEEDLLSEVDWLANLPLLSEQATADFNTLVSSLNAHYPDAITAKLETKTIAELVMLGLDDEVAEALSQLIDTEHSERDIVILFLSILANSEYGKDLSRHVKRMIRKAEKSVVFDLDLTDKIRGFIDACHV